MQQLVRVVTSSESAARDAATIQAGAPSRALMQRAGAAAAAEIALRLADRLGDGVVVFAGPGNNGGDAWVVARALRAAGVTVRVIEPVEAKTDDARLERGLFTATNSGTVDRTANDRGEAVVIDGLLGTGASGAPRGEMATAIACIESMRARGAHVVALDLPSGLDATTGAAPGAAVAAALTLSFGTIKRGQLLDRDRCGKIVALDIGLAPPANADLSPELVSEAWVASRLPHLAANAHKGTRKKIVIVGGASGMAGAAILAARAAARTAAGMIKLVVAPESIAAVQEAEPAALAAPWPQDDDSLERDVVSWADALVIGPGLGRGAGTRAMVERLLSASKERGLPVLLDADALNAFAGDAAALAPLLSGRPALITPHAVEFSRLAGQPVDQVLAHAFDAGGALADTIGACVLLKGVPTVISAPGGTRLISAEGTPALATAGSGDVLSGICGTLLAQLGDALSAGAAGAWLHGRAGERASAHGVRGATLDDVLEALARGWSLSSAPTRYPVLAELPGPDAWTDASVDAKGRASA